MEVKGLVWDGCRFNFYRMRLVYVGLRFFLFRIGKRMGRKGVGRKVGECFRVFVLGFIRIRRFLVYW